MPELDRACNIHAPRIWLTQSYGSESRAALGIYNFAGDLGKAILPAIVALLLPVLHWRTVVGLMGLLGILVASTLVALVPNRARLASFHRRAQSIREGRGGFGVLLSIGILDTATRMGYLLFLPFLIHARGGSSATVGLGLALIVRWGSVRQGKLWLARSARRRGWSVIATEIATAALIARHMFHAHYGDDDISAASRNGAERHIISPVWHGSRTRSQRQHQAAPSLCFTRASSRQAASLQSPTEQLATTLTAWSASFPPPVRRCSSCRLPGVSVKFFHIRLAISDRGTG